MAHDSPTHDSPTHPPATTRHSLPVAELQRARLHAELAGMEALAAARAVTHAQRRCSGAADDRLRFWHALYVELAPLHRAGSTVDAMANALTALSLESRTAILLRLCERLSPKAIAEVLDEPESRAAGHLAHAVIELRQRIGKQRSDGTWLRELTEWVHAHEPASARLQRVPASENTELPAAELPPAWIAKAPQRRSAPRRIGLWLALAGVLAAVGLARLTADRWLFGQPAPSAEPAEPAKPADPVAELMALPGVDLSIIDSALNLSLLPRLDFYFWLAGRTTPIADQDTTADLPLAAISHPLAAAAAANRAAVWQQLTAPERASVLSRLAEWNALGAAQHAALRLNLPHWASLDTADKQAVKHQHDAYLAMASNLREQLDAEFEALSPTQRRALLPEVVSDQNDLARELFVFVPIDEYAATMDMLAALPDSAQTDLRQLTRRLPPWQREALRVDLLAQAEATRADWLKQRLTER